jgi:hypothetical protein
VAAVLALSLLPSAVWGGQSQKSEDTGRPALPNRMLGLHQEEIDAYDSKAEPVARLTAALAAVNRTGWGLIHAYYPTLRGRQG